MNLTEQELNKLKEAKTEIDWNLICDEVRAARNDKYPPDWYEKVLASGLLYNKSFLK